MPDISIVIPVYNVEKYIEKCLDSIEKQTFKNFEVLCVDDCSPDNSVKIIEKFMERDNRFKLFHHEKNLKIGMARNTGLDNARGKYVVFVDSDDWLEPNMLEEIYNIFENNDVDSVWFNAFVHEMDGNIHNLHNKYHPVFFESCFFNVGPFELMAGTTYPWSKACKLDKIRQKNIKFPAVLHFEESEFYFKYFTNYRKAYYLDIPLYNYRLRENSVVTNTRKGNFKVEDTLYEFLHIYDYLKSENYFEEYKFALCQFLVRLINNHNLPNQHDKIVKLTKEVLKKIDFPNSFKDLETFEIKHIK